MRLIPPNAFELYFMGSKLYSKIIAKQLPNISQLVQKAIQAYQDFVNGKRIIRFNFDQASSYIDNEYDSPLRLPSLKKMKREFSPIE